MKMSKYENVRFTTSSGILLILAAFLTIKSEFPGAAGAKLPTKPTQNSHSTNMHSNMGLRSTQSEEDAEAISVIEKKHLKYQQQQTTENYYSGYYGYHSQPSPIQVQQPYYGNPTYSNNNRYYPGSYATDLDAGYYYQRPGRASYFNDVGASPSNQVAAASVNDYAYLAEPEFGGYASGSSHGHGYGYQTKESHVNTSAIGLLGLLGLLSLLQNVLLALTTTTTTTTSGRKKRGAEDNEDLTEEGSDERSGENQVDRICRLVLPSLNVVAHARDGKIPLECTHREVCVANQILVEELGPKGRPVGSMLSSAISKLLLKTEGTNSSLSQHLAKAGQTGRNEAESCSKAYPVCKALGVKGSLGLPQLYNPPKGNSLGKSINFQVPLPRPFIAHSPLKPSPPEMNRKMKNA